MSDRNIHWEYCSNTVVLAAHAHNPSIINDDFLRGKGIVPQDWGAPSPESVLITPVLARIEYGKFLLEVTADRFQLAERAEKGKSLVAPHDSEGLYRCAERYVEILPHIPYVAVGLNWDARAVIPDPVNWLKKIFLADKKWQDGKVAPDSFSVRLQQETYVCIITARIIEGAAVVHSNCHFDVSQDAEIDKRIISILNDWKRVIQKLDDDLRQYLFEE